MAEPLVVEAASEAQEGALRGLDEGLPQRQVLDGVPGQEHLREGHQTGTGAGSLTSARQHEIGVAREVMEGAAAPAVQMDVALSVDAGRGANWAEAH